MLIEIDGCFINPKKVLALEAWLGSRLKRITGDNEVMENFVKGTVIHLETGLKIMIEKRTPDNVYKVIWPQGRPLGG